MFLKNLDKIKGNVLIFSGYLRIFSPCFLPMVSYQNMNQNHTI